MSSRNVDIDALLWCDYVRVEKTIVLVLGMSKHIIRDRNQIEIRLPIFLTGGLVRGPQCHPVEQRNGNRTDRGT